MEIPQVAHLADTLIAPMNFSILYDNRAETHCNTNPAIPGNQPTGQMYGGYYVGCRLTSKPLPWPCLPC